MYDKAIILKIGKFREYDAWVRILTRQSGICTVFAFGASKSKRRFAGCLDTLNIIHASYEKSRKKDFLQLKEATLESAFALRKDWRLLGIATNCLRFIEALDISTETSEISFDFIKDFFDSLAQYQENGNNPNILLSLFRFKLASIQGYAPQIHYCVRCDSTIEGKSNIFSVQEGGILCKNCAENSFASASMHLAISEETLYVLRQVQTEDIHIWLEENMSYKTINEYSKIIDAFVQYHLGLEWQYSRFIHV